MRVIKALPANVAEQLRSSVAITSLDQVVLSLVANSLDASCSTIAIELDYSRANCSVEDDGVGIQAVELGPDGDLAKPYHTSKHNDSARPLHGFRGSSLAAVGAISILTAVSKTRADLKLSKLIIYQGERLHEPGRGKFIAEQLCNRRHGTLITVRDLFGNMPVRVKQRPTGDAGKRTRDRAFRGLLRELSALLLACGRDICLSVTATDNGHVWKLRPKVTAECRLAVENTADQSFNPSRLCNILTHVSEAQYKWSVWVQASASSPRITVRGLISKLPSSSRDTQFISLGIHPLPRAEAFRELYDTINNLMSASDFAHPNSGPEKAEIGREAISDPRGCVERDAKNPAEDVTRQPMYYIRIDIDSDPGPQLYRPSDIKTKDLNDMTGILKAMVIGFLENQNLRPRKKRRKRGIPATPVSGFTERGVPQRRQVDAFSGWSRMKSGLPVRHAGKITANSENPVEESPYAAGIYGLAEMRSSDDPFYGFDEEAGTRLCEQAEPMVSANGDELVSWVDAKIGQRHRVNARTGMIEDEQDFGAPTSSPHFRGNIASHAKSRITLGKGSDAPKVASAAQWADKVLTDWENPVFAPAEVAIPTANLDDTDLEQLLDGRQTTANVSKRFDAAFDRLRASVESKVTRSQLKHAEVIAQVDKKFILARIEGAIVADAEAQMPAASLILIDQHAADERIGVEKLLADACHIYALDVNDEDRTALTDGSLPATVRLEQPLIFDIFERDRALFEHDSQFFARWGISYTLRAPVPVTVAKSTASRRREGNVGCQLVVHGLPSTIAERCRADPSMLRKLLFDEMRQRDELSLTGAVPTTSRDPNGEVRRHAWLSHVHDCPKGMLDLINSRACRSAVMFNDELDLAQCEQLVRNLAETAFPFQCAHGRPSLVPLASADALAVLDDDGLGEDFENKFRAWMDVQGTDAQDDQDILANNTTGFRGEMEDQDRNT